MNEIPSELVKLFHTDPLVNAALTRYIRGDVSLEQALIAAVVALASQNELQRGHLIELYSSMPPSFRSSIVNGM